MDVKTVIMVEKKLSLEPLTIEDNINLEDMMKSGEFNEEVSWFEDFMFAINDLGKKELKAKMGFWKEEMDFKEMGTAASEEDFEVEAIPDAALKKMFAPNPSYETCIQYANRGQAIALKNIENEFDWNQNKWVFELDKKCKPDSISFKIEDNQTEIINEGIVDVKEETFTLSLDLDIMLPGKYYLKLIIDDKLLIHSFYIQKELMLTIEIEDE